MGHILRLPDEILLHAASYLDDATDYCALALTCHRLVPISQELLFTSPVLDRTSDGGAGSPIVSFLRTLLLRADLANFVQCLTIKTRSRTINHRAECTQTCCCGLDQTKILLQQRFENEGNPGGAAWPALLQQGREPAFAGVIITMLPSLHEITMRHTSETTDHIKVADFFGAPDASASIGVPSLQSLLSFKVHAYISPCFLAFTRLQRFSVDLTVRPSRSILRELFYASLPPTIHSLAVKCDRTIYYAGTNPKRTFLYMNRYLELLVNKLSGLRHATVLVYEPRGGLSFHAIDNVHYDALLRCFFGAKGSLETLELEDRGMWLWNLCVARAELLCEFSCLRQLTAPEEFYDHLKKANGMFTNSVDTLKIIRPSPNSFDLGGWMLEKKRSHELRDLSHIVMIEACDATSRLFRHHSVWGELRQQGVYIEWLERDI